MSLSPESYAKSIADCGYGSVLVYMDHLVGEKPCGYDGRIIVEKDGFLWDRNGDRMFPPYPSDDIKTREGLSKELFDQIQKIRENYIRKLEESGKKK